MTSEKASIQNEGTLVIDATCAPASIAYPRDLKLLNDARKQLEGTHTSMTSEKASIQNEGTLVIDATCAPASIAYPRDLKLLNDARKQLEGRIDHLHDQVGGKKPRTYRKKARKQYLLISKSKRPTRKKLRQAIRQQLEHVKRNLQYIEDYLNSGRILSDKPLGLLDVIKTLYLQQKEMYD